MPAPHTGKRQNKICISGNFVLLYTANPTDLSGHWGMRCKPCPELKDIQGSCSIVSSRFLSLGTTPGPWMELEKFRAAHITLTQLTLHPPHFVFETIKFHLKYGIFSLSNTWGAFPETYIFHHTELFQRILEFSGQYRSSQPALTCIPPLHTGFTLAPSDHKSSLMAWWSYRPSGYQSAPTRAPWQRLWGLAKHHSLYCSGTLSHHLPLEQTAKATLHHIFSTSQQEAHSAAAAGACWYAETHSLTWIWARKQYLTSLLGWEMGF